MNIPNYVHAAKVEMLIIPERFAVIFPSPEKSVQEFLSIPYPPQSSELISSKVTSWFSHDAPVTDAICLLSRPIPSEDFITDLSKALGQAWFDGAKSIVDRRYNNDGERLPFWVISLWKQLNKVNDQQVAWRNSIEWLDKELGRSKNEELTTTLLAAKEELNKIGWNAPLPYIGGQSTTSFSLSSFLSFEWLSDDHLNMMSEELSTHVASDPVLATKYIIAPLGFSRELISASKFKTYSRKDTPLLCRYADHIKEKNLERLYFGFNVSNRHWVTAFVDFKSKHFGFGK